MFTDRCVYQTKLNVLTSDFRACHVFLKLNMFLCFEKISKVELREFISIFTSIRSMFCLCLVAFIFRHEKTRTFRQTNAFLTFLGFRNSGSAGIRILVQR